MANLKGYEAIKAKSEEIGWPMHYKVDLYASDRGILESDYAPKTFGWSVREMGTDLFCYASSHTIASAWFSKCYRQEQRWFWFDGDVLEELTFHAFFSKLLNAEPACGCTTPINANFKHIEKRIEELRAELVLMQA